MKKEKSRFKITWPKTIIFAVLIGIFTALMAIFVPESCSFHDIAVTMEAWILFAIIIVMGCDTPLDAALKTFVFFLISQPLVYLIQVPFNSMGWGLFSYYPYWFGWTLLTLPGAYVAWFIKKDNVWSSLILSVALVFLAWSGVGFAISCFNNFPNHLLTAIYCFAIIPVLIFTILKSKLPRIIASAVVVVATVIIIVLKFAYAPSVVNGMVVLNLSKTEFDTKDGWSLVTNEFDGYKLEIAELDDYDEWGNSIDSTYYILRIRFSANAFGEHQVDFINAANVTKTCALTISEEGDHSLKCQ